MSLQTLTDDTSLADDPVIQWVTFKLNNEIYGINVMQVQEVLRYTEIAHVPGAPSYVLGIINLRGNVVTIIDTRKKFDLPVVEISDQTRIIILESKKQVMGILVDSVAEVVYLKSSEIEQPPKVGSSGASEFLHGVCHRDGELLILINISKLLSEQEWDAVNQISNS